MAKLIHFRTLLALVVGGMELVQPAAAGVLTGLTLRIDLGHAFQRRQTSIPQVPPQCATICNPIINIITTNTCTPSTCCLASFETSFFNCFVCAAASVNATDYSEAQVTLDGLYDSCASLGIQLPVLTFPGQNPNRGLSSVVSSQTTISTVITSSITQTTIGPSSTPPAIITTSPQITATTNTPTPTSSSGSRSVETSCFDLIAGAMMLGTWFYFAV